VGGQNGSKRRPPIQVFGFGLLLLLAACWHPTEHPIRRQQIMLLEALPSLECLVYYSRIMGFGLVYSVHKSKGCWRVSWCAMLEKSNGFASLLEASLCGIPVSGVGHPSTKV
jgi:hypothetical protein